MRPKIASKVLNLFYSGRIKLNLLDANNKEIIISKVKKETKEELLDILDKIPGPKLEWNCNETLAIQFANIEDGIIATGKYNIYYLDGLINIMENKCGTNN